MNYNIKGTGLPVTPELRQYVEKKLQPADKLLLDAPAHADVELEYAPLRDGDKYRAEFTVEAQGGLKRIESWGGTLHEAIDIGAGELHRELRQSKQKRLDVVRRTAVRVKEYVRGWRKSV